MKITEYPSISSLTDDNVFLVDGNNGTKKIPVKDAILSVLDSMSPINHRTVFRGKNLGTEVTDEQFAAIQNGSFKDLWLGDYWVHENHIFRIVDFDYWYNTGDTKCTKHHVVVMPDKPMTEAQMNASNTTAGGYAESAMRTSKTMFAPTISNWLKSNDFMYRNYFTNVVTDGYPSAGSWYDADYELPSETMIFGTKFYGVPSSPSVDINCYTIDKTQLALFRVAPEFINIGETYWLRDVANAVRFAFVSDDGEASYTNASNNRGVRPVFGIGI